MLVRAGAILGLVMLETRPPRCRECGVLGGGNRVIRAAARARCRLLVPSLR